MGANLLALRSHNTALVLDLLRTAGTDGISRLELADRTGLTPQAVSKITARLRDSGLAAEAGRRASTGGKPRTVLRLVPGAGHAVGVHLDRDELRVVLVDLMGEVVGERRAPLDLGAGAGVVVEAVAREVEGLVGGAVGGVEVRGTAGPAGEAVGGAVVRGVEGSVGDSAVRGTEGLVGDADEASVGLGAEVPVGDSAVQAEGLAGDAVAARGARGAKGPAGGSAVREAEGLAGDVAGDSVVRGAESAVGDPALQEAEGLAGVADEDPGARGAKGPAGGSAMREAEGLAGDADEDPVVRETEGALGDPAVQEETAPAEDAVADPVAQGAPPPPSAPARNLLGVGVALPGPLDHAHGILHRVTGFPEWDGFPLRDALARRLGVPVVVDKDTNAAALGLAVAGEGGSFAYLHLGTGLGAGLVIGGGVHRGARTGAGEFGHQVIQLDGPLCDCGNRGCIEALCLAAVARGDLDEAARVLGTGAGNLVGLLDIDLVLLGGRTVAADPEPFVRGVAAVLDAHARREGAREAAVPVRVAPGGARGVAEGAAQLLLGPLFGRADG